MHTREVNFPQRRIKDAKRKCVVDPALRLGVFAGTFVHKIELFSSETIRLSEKGAADEQITFVALSSG